MSLDCIVLDKHTHLTTVQVCFHLYYMENFMYTKELTKTNSL